MKQLAMVLGLVLVLSATASAQDLGAQTGTVDEPGSSEPGDGTSTSDATDGASDDADDGGEGDEDDRGVYSKKVRGLLWLEVTAGPTSYKPGQFRSVSVNGMGIGDLKLTGPEFSGAVLVGLGGFNIGVRARGANYDPFNLVAVGLEMGGTFRFIPYVHPIVRFGLNYAKLTDLPDTGTNLKSDGVAVDVGVGVRIPIVRWISFAATFNWSFIGMFVRDNDTSAEAVLGQQLTRMFALTFHFIGVRKGD